MCAVLITSLPGNDSTAQWRVWAWSSCTERSPGRIYTQNYLACLSLSSPFHAPSREGEGLPVTLGWSDTDGTPDVWPELVMGEWCWCEEKLTPPPRAASLLARAPHICSFPYVFIYFKKKKSTSVLTHPCPGLVASLSTVAPPSCCTQLAAPPFPAATGAPLGPSAWQGWALPHQSSLAAAALSCALADGTGVGQSHSSCDCVWGHWGAGRMKGWQGDLPEKLVEVKWLCTVSKRTSDSSEAACG